MSTKATFEGLEPYKLTGIIVTDRELGHGSYATVLELQYMGLKCAGKKIHELLLRQGGASYTVRRFEEECRLLSQVRHPNIVQFLGVHFQQGVPVPILVMEFLPTNLTSCIEQYGILPKEISYSILHDVALGLCCLHSLTPSIIHRDLSSNNVLLTPNMTAKISDLGVARIIKLTPLQVSHMTQTPGTPAYMPPEVMVANTKYDTSIDEFSYGILMIHMFSGRWPEPQVGPSQIEGGRLVPVTEAERREVFLRAIGNNHPLMDMILVCINNDPRRRAQASKLVERLAEMVLQFPASTTNQLEMLRQIDHLEGEKKNLMSKEEKQQEDTILRKEVRVKEEEITQLNLVCSSQMEQLKLQVQDLNSQNQLLVDTKEADVTELKTEVAICQTQIKDLEAQQENTKKMLETKLHKEREEFEMQLVKEREISKKLTHRLQAEMSQSTTKTNSLQQKVSTLKAEASRKTATVERIESLLKAKTRTLEEKQAIISGLSEKLTRATEHIMSSKSQVSLVTHNIFSCTAVVLAAVTLCTYNFTVVTNYVKGAAPNNHYSMQECSTGVTLQDHKPL